MLPQPSRVESFFPPQTAGAAEVLLLAASAGGVPPLDLLKLATFLRRRGYAPRLLRALPAGGAMPFAVVLSSIFSWETPGVRALAVEAHGRWPATHLILSGVLPRRLGDGARKLLPVQLLDGASEDLLDCEAPDYRLTPEWDASIVITSKGVCPRECGHCSAAARGKGVTKLVPGWARQLDRALSRVEVWDNTLMLTPRTHFAEVAARLRESGKPVDLVCGLAPGGVDEPELGWRISTLAGVRLVPVRLECNRLEDLPRFRRLLLQARAAFGTGAEYRAFAVVNGSEPPEAADERIDALRAEGVTVDCVRYTPHDWEQPEPYVNRAAGWSAESLAAFA